MDLSADVLAPVGQAKVRRSACDSGMVCAFRLARTPPGDSKFVHPCAFFVSRTFHASQSRVGVPWLHVLAT